MLDTEDQGYYVTPCDVITFASNGSDGIHFGFLTDFGTVTDLEEAYVVYVSPMDFGSAVFLAARNLKEFMNLLFTMKDTMEIANFLSIEMMDESEKNVEYEEDEEDEEDEYEEDEYEEEDEDIEIYDDEELIQEREYVLGKLKESLNCSVIEDVNSYYKNLFDERKKQIAIHTKDRIGVIPMSNQPIIAEKYEVEKDMYIEIKDLQAYFRKAPIENKLAFVRDAQCLGIILDERDVREFIVTDLRQLGFKLEADLLKRRNEWD